MNLTKFEGCWFRIHLLIIGSYLQTIKQFNNWCTFPGAPTLWIQHSPAEFCDLGGENQGKQQELSNEKQGPLVVWDI